ncbi:MAG: peptidylprolyl isomerase [Peptoniphilus sp.]|nr:peptidylprolyl isomerase [Peptoniphilus sp.]MDD7363732.1 peptidylprolyl isomerase [Bacillota bacterium]MDY6044117.1 peptidylprolyl isomerase [Peptoniphilus sp.]
MTEENKLLATVDGVEIHASDVDAYLQSMNPQMAIQFQGEEGKQHILDELIRQELLLKDALDRHLDDEEEFKKVFKDTKHSLLKSYNFSKAIEGASVSEEEQKAFYEENKQFFKSPESVHAAHILVDDEDKAKDIAKQLNDGANFEELAKKESTCPSNERGGDLGTFGRGQMVPEFDEKVFDMKDGEISDPVKTQFGYHIIKRIEGQPEEMRDYDDVKDEINMELMRRKQQELYLNKVNELEKHYKVERK